MKFSESAYREIYPEVEPATVHVATNSKSMLPDEPDDIGDDGLDTPDQPDPTPAPEEEGQKDDTGTGNTTD